MDAELVAEHITQWLKNYSDNSGTDGFVIGISGGIDSAVTSTLCAMTGKRVIVISMPIRQNKSEYDRGNEHIAWLCGKYKNVEPAKVDLTAVLESIEKVFPGDIQDFLTM